MKKLLILHLVNGTFGVWQDEIESTRNDLTIHSFPYANPYVSGIVLVNDHFSSVADLSVCLGYEALKTDTKSVLLLPGENEIVGFVVPGDVKEVEVDSDEVFPIDKCVQTKLVASCLVHNGELIPLVNLASLHKMVQEPGYKPSEQPLLLDQLQRKEKVAQTVHNLVCAGQSFAVEVTGVSESLTLPQTAVSLNYLPDYVKALFLMQKEVLPLFSLARMIRFSENENDNTVLLANCGDQSFGILVEADRGPTASQAGRKALPALVRSKWLNQAIVENQEIFPLIELAPLIVSLAEADEAEPEPAVYHPDTGYESNAKELEVIEFSISGVKHAVPRKEFADRVNLRTITRIPNVSPMVLGVVEHENAILPVLDMAPCYGEKSKVTPRWEMILIKNGDFHAFVVTDKVYGFRTLQSDSLLQLPFKQNKQFVYDCYPEENADTVILILNIQSIAVNLESKPSQDILKVFSADFRPSDQEPVKPVSEPVMSEPVAAMEEDQTDVTETVEVTPQETVEEQQPAEDEMAPEPETSQIEDASTEASSEIADESAEESVAEEMEETTPEATVEVTDDFDEEQPALEPSQADSTDEPDEVETTGKAPEEPEEPEEEEEIEEGLQAAKIELDDEKATGASPSKPEQQTVKTDIGSERKNNKKTIVKDWAKLKKIYKSSEHRRIRKVYTLVAALFLVAVCYLFVPFQQIGIDSQRIEVVKKTIPREASPVVVSPPPQKTAEVAQKPISTEEFPAVASPLPQKAAEVKKEQVVQEIKPEPSPSLPAKKQKIDYVVKKGDYLFKITKSYTGDGYDYPKVQKENKIPNANLIYPDQVIKISVEKDQKKE